MPHQAWRNLLLRLFDRAGLELCFRDAERHSLSHSAWLRLAARRAAAEAHAAQVRDLLENTEQGEQDELLEKEEQDEQGEMLEKEEQ